MCLLLPSLAVNAITITAAAAADGGKDEDLKVWTIKVGGHPVAFAQLSIQRHRIDANRRLSQCISSG